MNKFKAINRASIWGMIGNLFLLIIKAIIGIANNATGNIKYYQIVEGSTLLLIIPIAYIVLKLGGNPISVFWVQLIIMYINKVIGYTE